MAVEAEAEDGAAGHHFVNYLPTVPFVSVRLTLGEIDSSFLQQMKIVVNTNCYSVSMMRRRPARHY